MLEQALARQQKRGHQQLQQRLVCAFGCPAHLGRGLDPPWPRLAVVVLSRLLSVLFRKECRHAQIKDGSVSAKAARKGSLLSKERVAAMTLGDGVGRMDGACKDDGCEQRSDLHFVDFADFNLSSALHVTIQEIEAAARQ